MAPRTHESVVELAGRILPAGMAVQVDPPPAPPPIDFEDGFVLPAHYEKPLQSVHAHPLDAGMCFYEVPHKYTYKGTPMSTSVTTLAHEFEKPFDARGAIAMMKMSRSQAWPRLEYVRNATTMTDWTSTKGALLVLFGRTAAACQPCALREDATQDDAKRVLGASIVKGFDVFDEDDAEWYAFDRVLRDDEIQALWSHKGLLARNKGTYAHYQAELFFNGLPCHWRDAEMEIVLDFTERELIPRGLVAFNTEKEIVCVDADVAGSIDLILYDPVKKIHHIVDHKRSDKLQSQLRGYGSMKAPFRHLPQCNGASYALQTSIYQYILERDYGMTIGDRILLSLHPDKPFATSVPYLKEEAHYLLDKRIALAQARREVAQKHPAFTCALTGGPLVDAVTLSDGRKAMENAAIVQDLPYEPDVEMRATFDAFVDSCKRVVTFVTPKSSWTSLVPEAGIPPFSRE